MNRDDILNAPGERQISRRNEVCFVKCGDALCVRKKYLQPGASQTERDTLALLAQAGLAVPRVLYSEGEYTVLEHIPGMTYEAVLANYESGEMRKEELSDALGALRIAAKLVDETPEAISIADMDGDGEITVVDALKILRISVGLE